MGRRISCGPARHINRHAPLPLIGVSFEGIGILDEAPFAVLETVLSKSLGSGLGEKFLEFIRFQAHIPDDAAKSFGFNIFAGMNGDNGSTLVRCAVINGMAAGLSVEYKTEPLSG